jgi:UDP-glucose 4-epimerase
VTELERILITGGFGYIGGRLAQHLARTAHQQVVLGSRNPRQPPLWLSDASVVQTDWASDEALSQICRNVDAIVHLAGMNAQECAADSVGALEMNGMVTSRLLRAAVGNGVKRFIYVSTAHVYGSPLRGSITERSCSTSLHPYATSHRAGEDAVLRAHEQKEIQGVVIRLSNSFGPPMDERANCWMLLVNDLCRQAVTAQRMVLHSSGIQRRDFVALTDACRAIAHLLNLEDASSGDGLFNVGGAWAPTVLEMAERIAACCHKAFGFQPEIVRPQSGRGDTAQALDYRIDKLLSSGFALMHPVDAEIIATLQFCSATKRQMQ